MISCRSASCPVIREHRDPAGRLEEGQKKKDPGQA